jgi:signal transduction histidine kinase
MSDGQRPSDPRWPKLLSLAVHEFRTPITVVAGYIRMLLKDRAGPISDQQRRLLEEAEKSCGRLSALVAEMSDLSNLEAGTAAVNTSSVDLRTVIEEAIAAMPPMADREVSVQLESADHQVSIQGDPTRVRAAFIALMVALRRELINSDVLLVRLDPADIEGSPGAVIAMGDEEQLSRLTGVDTATLPRFDEWRGGSGLSLAVARRVIAHHGGMLLGPPDDAKAGAVVAFRNVSAG